MLGTGCVILLWHLPSLPYNYFPLTGFVCKEAHVTFGGSGGLRSNARPELPYPCTFRAKSQDETSRRRSKMTVRSHVYKRYANYKLGSV